LIVELDEQKVRGLRAPDEGNGMDLIRSPISSPIRRAAWAGRPP